MPRKHVSRAALFRNLLLVIVGVLAFGAVGCGGDDGMGPDEDGTIDVSGEIAYGRHRNAAGQVSPILAESGSGFDGIEVDSPAIAIDGGRVGGDKFLLYYEADGPGGSTIGLISSDEEDFVPLVIARTQVIGLGTVGQPHTAGATDPTVAVDKRAGEETRRYKMWFEGRSGAAGQTSQIVFATSTDGVTWEDLTVCVGLNPTFGSVRVADPTVVRDADIFKMWFEAIQTTTPLGIDGSGRIGYAESSDGVNWIIKDAAGNTGSAASSVFGAGPAGRFDAYSVNAPSVVLDVSVSVGANGRYKMWYEAGDKEGDVQNTIGYATSANGLTWSRASLPVFGPSSDAKVPLPFDSGDLEHPCAAIDLSVPANTDGHFLLWYTGDGEGGVTPNRVGFASGRVP